jgi:CRISPR system Cascade subunit CasD
MNTLLLLLSGPMQSWGVQSRFTVRDTGLEPSKSGVIGLLCAALGRARDEPLDDLAALIMGVRIDREGRLSRDYHVAQNVLKAGGGIKPTEPSTRYYLADAVFLVGLQGEDLSLLQSLQEALYHPVWLLYLGRKAFVPGKPVALPDGLKEDTPLEVALSSYPYQGRGQPPERLRGVIEDLRGTWVRPDQPISFSSGDRRFNPRRMRPVTFATPPQTETSIQTEEVD